MYGVLDFLDIDKGLLFLLFFAEHGLQVLADGLHFGIVAFFVLSYFRLCLFSEVVLDHLVLNCDLLYDVFVLAFAALFLLHVEGLDLALQLLSLFLTMALCFSLILGLYCLFFLPQELVDGAIKFSDLSLVVRFDLFDLIQMAQKVVLVLGHELRRLQFPLGVKIPQFCLFGALQLQFLVLMRGDKFVH